MPDLLKVNDLSVSFFKHKTEMKAVTGISFIVREGETLGIVGESGCGKSVAAQSLMRLISAPGKIVSGKILFQGQDILRFTEREMQEIRGKDICMVFQEPLTSLNPVLTIGFQMTEVLRRHTQKNKKEAFMLAEKYLEQVGITNPKTRLKQYPHEISGGMQQRIMIAMALLCNPRLLIADEPTTFLDVTTQAQILGLLKKVRENNHTSIILITHDLAVAANLCSRILIMVDGKIVESGLTTEIFKRPKHPYTQSLLYSLPQGRLDEKEVKPRLSFFQETQTSVTGCGFVHRCSYALNICLTQMPDYKQCSADHQVACWLYDARVKKPVQ